MKNAILKVLKIITISIMLISLCSCANNNEPSTTENNDVSLEFNTISDLKDKRIGILAGSIYDQSAKKRLSEEDFSYFNSVSDLVSAMQSNKIDAFVADENIVRELVKDNNDLGYIDETVAEIDAAIMFGKSSENEKLLSEFNEFITKSNENGLTAELKEKRENYDENTTILDYESFENKNGSIKVSVFAESIPYSFILNGKVVGYEIELIANFCQEKGYAVEYIVSNTDSIVASVATGKTNMSVGGLNITEERKKSVNFSLPTTITKQFFVVRKVNTSSTAFLSKISDSFQRTFIKENRWKMFLEGILTTMSITILSLLLGTILGFIAYTTARRNFNGLFAKFVNFIIWLIHGMPMVVLLMILYYIIFGNVSINGFYVAVIGFTLSFACSMYSMLLSGEKAIDKGQNEAAFTLGYTPSQTFYKIILPQAAYHFLPSYKAEIVSLIKATAVVGYIAVQDITKIGDIIRSRTYEAFFPLIVIAIMYFVMAAILTYFVNKIDYVIDPEKKDKKRILKEIDISKDI